MTTSALRAPASDATLGEYHVPDIDRAAIAAWLQAARLAANKTQRETAIYLSVEKQTVSNWETGRHPIGGLELLRLSAWYKAEDSLIALLRSAREEKERNAPPLPGSAIRKVTGGKRRGSSDKKEGGAR